MASFTIRVELRDAEWQDYLHLHQQMQLAGFTRTIISSGGVAYDLPDAEYNFEGDASATYVREIARAAADSTGRKNGVLVTESVRRVWIGLEPA